MTTKMTTRELYDARVKEIVDSVSSDKDRESVELFEGLIKLAGHIEDGSSVGISIAQDDATRDWVIHVGKQWTFGPSFRGAVRNAIKEFGQ